MQIPDHGPLTPEQRAAFNQFLESLTPTQKTWISGFFTGLSSPAGSESTAPDASAPQLTILYGSESGNSEGLAERTSQLATAAGFKPTVVDMAETDTKKLFRTPNLLVIVSTWGEGDPPDTATDFYSEIMSPKAAKFAGNYSVCALGDTSYEQFCEIGRQIDKRLGELGGKRIFDRQDCDVDFEDDWKKWVEAALPAFPVKPAPAGASASKAVATLSTGGTVYNRKNPYSATIAEKFVLNGTGSSRETLHVELELAGSGLQYEVGDSLAIVPQNRDEDVQGILGASGLSANTQFSDKTLAEALKTDFDITSLTSRIAGKYNAIAKNKKLEAFLAPEKKKEFTKWSQGRQLVDLLEEYPCKNLTAESLTGILRKMAPRLYSIASSLKAHPGEVHITIEAVRYRSHGKDRVGVASTYVADLVESGDEIPVYIHSNKNFRLPADPSTPIIMIGPGTGIAPFRAFVEERRACSAPGKNWLIFGDQHYTYDFLYQLEWQRYLKEKALDRLDVAFSRDQPEKVYVQDKLREFGKEVYQWIEEGAHVYVCGDTKKMAPAVNATLQEIIAEHGKLTAKKAEAFLADLKKAKRYQRDVY